MGWRGLGGMAAAATALAAALAFGATAERTVFGTLRAAGPVEVTRDDVRWQPIVGGQVVEGASVRTGLGGGATLDLPNGDVLGFGDGTLVRLVAATPAQVRLESGRVVLNLRAGSGTTIETDLAVVREPVGSTLDDPRREGTVVVGDGQAAVRCAQGDLEVAPRAGGLVSLEAGETVTLAGDGSAPAISRSPVPHDPWNAPRVVGNPASDPKLKPSPLMAQMAVAAAIIVGGVSACLGLL